MRSHGIVLHALRYGDSQLIVDVFTERAGTVSFLLRQSRQGKAGVKASMWQPLSLVEVVWESRLKASLQKPRELVLWQPWHNLPFHPVKAAMSLYLGEFLHHALRHEQENVSLFHYLVNALSWFDETETAYVNFHIVFLLHMTRFLGFMPSVENWEKGAYFDLQAATFTPTRPFHPHFLEPEEAALVPKFLRMDIRSMRAVGLNGAIRRRVLEIVSIFYRLHVPEFPELKSLDVLTEVFA